jgi:hypothetical protein
VSYRTAYADVVTMAKALWSGSWYGRPTGRIRLGVKPRLARWDLAANPSQIRLARWLDHLEEVLAPVTAGAGERLAVELVVGLPKAVPLAEGGRDLDKYLFPMANRLGAPRLAAVFGRKVHGASSVAVSNAMPAATRSPPQFTTRMAGSYEDVAWRQRLRAELVRAGAEVISPGPVAIDVAITTGSGRNSANLWKPLLDAFGPVLGESEDPSNPFKPHDDRIVSLGLHHNVEAGLRHDFMIHAWWAAMTATAEVPRRWA